MLARTLIPHNGALKSAFDASRRACPLPESNGEIVGLALDFYFHVITPA